MKHTASRGKFAAGTTATLASLSIVSRPVSGAEYKWKWGAPVGLEHPICVRAVEAFAKIRKETNGQLDIKAFPNSILGSDSATLNDVRVGALEMLVTAGAILDAIVPVAG